jgi:hypothetical protein
MIPYLLSSAPYSALAISTPPGKHCMHSKATRRVFSVSLSEVDHFYFNYLWILIYNQN